MKKVNVCLILMLLSVQHIFAQDRVNKQLPKISGEIMGKLDKATGWLYGDDGQWISRKNRIPVYVEEEYKSLIDYEKRGLGKDNFNFYELKTIKIDNKEYYIIIKEFKSGYYKYRNIKEGWVSADHNVYYYIFEKSELEKLSSIKNTELNVIKIKCLYAGSKRFLDKVYYPIIEKEISKKILNPSKYEPEHYLTINFKPFGDKKIVQFLIFDIQKTSSGGILVDGLVASPEYKTKYDTEDIYKKFYYETDYESFNKFLKIE